MESVSENMTAISLSVPIHVTEREDTVELRSVVIARRNVSVRFKHVDGTVCTTCDPDRRNDVRILREQRDLQPVVANVWKFRLCDGICKQNRPSQHNADSLRRGHAF